MRRFGLGFMLRAWMDADRNLDFLAEAAEDRHQSVDREAGEIGAADTREIGRQSRLMREHPAPISRDPQARR